MKMKTLVAALSGAFLLGAVTLAPAQKTPSEPARTVQPSTMENKAAGMSGDQYKVEKNRIEADAKSAKAACKSMKDNAKDVCEAEAKGKEKLAKKELDYKKNPNDKNAQDVEKMKAEVAYELQKEKCEDMKGADMASCKKTAKSEKDRALAAAKGKKIASADMSATTARTSTTSSTMPSSGTTSSKGMATSPATAPATKPSEDKKSPGK